MFLLLSLRRQVELLGAATGGAAALLTAGEDHGPALETLDLLSIRLVSQVLDDLAEDGSARRHLFEQHAKRCDAWALLLRLVAALRTYARTLGVGASAAEWAGMAAERAAELAKSKAGAMFDKETGRAGDDDDDDDDGGGGGGGGGGDGAKAVAAQLTAGEQRLHDTRVVRRVAGACARVLERFSADARTWLHHAVWGGHDPRHSVEARRRRALAKQGAAAVAADKAMKATALEAMAAKRAADEAAELAAAAEKAREEAEVAGKDRKEVREAVNKAEAAVRRKYAMLPDSSSSAGGGGAGRAGAEKKTSSVVLLVSAASFLARTFRDDRRVVLAVTAAARNLAWYRPARTLLATGMRVPHVSRGAAGRVRVRAVVPLLAQLLAQLVGAGVEGDCAGGTPAGVGGGETPLVVPAGKALPALRNVATALACVVADKLLPQYRSVTASVVGALRLLVGLPGAPPAPLVGAAAEAAAKEKEKEAEKKEKRRKKAAAAAAAGGGGAAEKEGEAAPVEPPLDPMLARTCARCIRVLVSAPADEACNVRAVLAGATGLLLRLACALPAGGAAEEARRDVAECLDVLATDSTMLRMIGELTYLLTGAFLIVLLLTYLLLATHSPFVLFSSHSLVCRLLVVQTTAACAPWRAWRRRAGATRRSGSASAAPSRRSRDTIRRVSC